MMNFSFWCFLASNEVASDELASDELQLLMTSSGAPLSSGALLSSGAHSLQML
jgi:hypothetical protein